MSRRVLFIAYLFPPIANSGTQRPLKFAKYLPQFGWEPIVLTAHRVSEHRQDHGLLEDVPLDMRVVRVPMLNDRIGAVAGTLGLGVVKRKTIAEGISWRLRNRWRSPDLYALWRPTARRAAMKLYRDVGFDAIYATGFPWTSLLTGMDVSKLTGRPLVADFRDLWASEDLFKPADRCPRSGAGGAGGRSRRRRPVDLFDDDGADDCDAPGGEPCEVLHHTQRLRSIRHG